MAEYMLVNATKLDSDLKELADHIRAKTNSSEKLLFPDGMIAAVDSAMGLAFSVIAGEERPASPAENTIWIKAERMTDWVISHKQPEKAETGVVWILNGESNDNSFNALKQNGIIIHPESAKQYSINKWEDVPMEIYQNGVWSNTAEIIYLYYKGDECASITGGWRIQSQSEGNFSSGSGSKNMSSISLNAAASYYQNVEAITQNKIDVTNLDTISINITSRSGIASANGYLGAYLYLSPSNSAGNHYKNGALFATIDSTGKTEIDVSQVTGSFYVVVSCFGAALTFDEVY